MGFETAVVITIFFVSILFLGTQSYAVMSTSNDVVSDAENIRYQMQYQKLNSNINIDTLELNEKASTLYITATNTGNIVLSSDEMSILLDGNIINYTFTPATNKWYPAETKMFTVIDETGFTDKRVKVVTESGVTAYITGVPEKAKKVN